MRTLIRGCGVARCAEGLGWLALGQILIQDGVIEGVFGPDERVEADEIIDGDGLVVTPGLIDCHTHLVWAGNRANEFEARMEGRSYAEIARDGGGILATVRATRAADEETLYRLAEERLDALVSTGVTTVEIKSGYGLDLETELRCLRVARRLGERSDVTVTTTYLGLHAVPPEFGGRADDYVDWVCAEALPAVAASGLADAVDAFAETVAFSREQTDRYFRAARALGLPVKLHADQLSAGGGGSLAASFEALSADHVEYTSAECVKAMGRCGTVAVLLPGAFFSLRETQRPPVAQFRECGVPMAVATDCNPGTSPTTDLPLMLHMACVQFGLTPEEAILGATRWAAQALGLPDRGQIAVGMRADLTAWRVEHPRDICAWIGGRRPAWRMVAGKIFA